MQKNKRKRRIKEQRKNLDLGGASIFSLSSKYPFLIYIYCISNPQKGVWPGGIQPECSCYHQSIMKKRMKKRMKSQLYIALRILAIMDLMCIMTLLIKESLQ